MGTGTRGAGNYFVAEAIPFIEQSQLPPLKELSKVWEIDIVNSQVICECDTEGFIVSITPTSLITQQGFSTIPDVITSLTRLTSLNLEWIPVRGTLPASMGNMTNLQELKIMQVASGSIPASFGNMASLQSLTISVSDYDTTGDALTGPIPESFSNLKNLTSLNLTNNNIGPLTDSIGTIPNLEYLYLTGNNFTGSTIPSTIAGLSKLLSLRLDYTGVGGSIPSGLGLLPDLATLRLEGNKLTGTLPPTLGAPPLLSFNYDPTVACPAKNTSCVVEQSDSSPFCTACAAFCSSCIPPAPAPASDAPPSIAQPSDAAPSEALPSEALPRPSLQFLLPSLHLPPSLPLPLLLPLLLLSLLHPTPTAAAAPPPSPRPTPTTTTPTPAPMLPRPARGCRQEPSWASWWACCCWSLVSWLLFSSSYSVARGPKRWRWNTRLNLQEHTQGITSTTSRLRMLMLVTSLVLPARCSLCAIYLQTLPGICFRGH